MKPTSNQIKEFIKESSQDDLQYSLKYAKDKKVIKEIMKHYKMDVYDYLLNQ